MSGTASAAEEEAEESKWNEFNWMQSGCNLFQRWVSSGKMINTDGKYEINIHRLENQFILDAYDQYDQTY